MLALALAGGALSLVACFVLALRYGSAARDAGSLRGQLAVMTARSEAQARDVIETAERLTLSEQIRHRSLADLAVGIRTRDEEIGRLNALLAEFAARDPVLAHARLAGVLQGAGAETPDRDPRPRLGGSVSVDTTPLRKPGS